MRFFNTAGPIKPDMNYHIPPLERLDLDDVLALIQQEKYFVLHAPRQTGKTSALLMQHTEETGQAWTEEALDEVWRLTQGQPWLVNALAYEACFENKTGRDRSRSITAEAIGHAREQLILRRETHLDQLTDKLQEERVQRVVDPLLSGIEPTDMLRQDDAEYVRDLGLVRLHPFAIANPIYQEVIPRDLTYTTQIRFRHDPAWYVDADGPLKVADLLTAFQAFFREHSEHWVERFQYKEVSPQLLLQAFLQRIVNHGGRIEREYGLGRMRTDLLIIWPVFGDGRSGQEVQRVVVECKVLYKSLAQTVRVGLEQTLAYMDRCGTLEGHLVVFDRRVGKSWDEKIFRREEGMGAAKITVWGM